MIDPSTNQRELAYVVTIDEIRAIENYDRIEHARVGGWWIVVKKDQFKVGDLAIYIEIDSKVPVIPAFEFLEKKHYAVKTQKFCKGQAISQGLLMSPADFGWTIDKEIIWDDESNVLVKGSFVTEKLGITYYEPEDNVRKANPEDKYKKMAQRRPKIFKTRFARWMMKREWGRKVMFFFFGRKRDVKSGWPTWVKKTDEERVQNLPHLFPNNSKEYIVTEKIDGTSTTFTIRGRGRKQQFFVCSRNVVFDKPDKKCFYETNVYTEMAEKYNIEKKLKELITKNSDIDFITIQAETYGEGVQKRSYGLKEHKLAVFNVIIGYIDGLTIRFNPILAKEWCDKIELPFVPIIAENFVLPTTCDELLEYAASEPSKIDGEMREGLVFRDYNGEESFKAVSNAFLEKYHS